MKTTHIFRAFFFPLFLITALVCGCSNNEPEPSGSNTYLAIVDNNASALYDKYSRFFPNVRSITVNEALTMPSTQFADVDRVVFFSSLSEAGSSLGQLWESYLKPVREKSIMVMSVGEGVAPDKVIEHSGINFGHGLYLKSMKPAGNVVFLNADEFDETKISNAVESLYNQPNASEKTPQVSHKTFEIKKSYTGKKQATLHPSYDEKIGDPSFTSNDRDKIIIQLHVDVAAYSYPGSSDRYVEVTIQGDGVRPFLDLNDGNIFTDRWHNGTSYLKNLAQYYFINVKAQQPDGSPLVFSYLPDNELSHTTISNSRSLSFGFNLGTSPEADFSFGLSREVSYTQTDFQTVANRWSSHSGKEAVMEWRVRAQNMSVKDKNGTPKHQGDAWTLAETTNHRQTECLNTKDITHTEIPTDFGHSNNTSFIAKQSDLPQMYSNFAPNMLTAIYTTSSTLNLRVEGGVVCQHTATNYTLGSRVLGSSTSFAVQSFSHYGTLDVDFGNNTVCLMDK